MAKTERKFLEAAAKAEGHAYPWFEARGGQMREWNPLTDDGDALRLAVKLGIDPHFGNAATWVRWPLDQRCAYLHHEPHGDDPYAATRRAIVRAAAKMGVEQP